MIRFIYLVSFGLGIKKSPQGEYIAVEKLEATYLKASPVEQVGVTRSARACMHACACGRACACVFLGGGCDGACVGLQG
jgi:hypothetical protein